MSIHRRTAGTTSWQVSEVGFGAWAIGGGWGRQDKSESRRTLHAAIDEGVNIIDTAQGYGDGLSEQRPIERLLPACERAGVGFIPRVPFDEGALTGKYTTATTFAEDDVRRHYFRGANLGAAVSRVESVRRFKNERHPDMSMPEFALRFVLSHASVSAVIPGMRNRNQVMWNTAAGDGRHLAAEEIDEMRNLAWLKDFWFEEVEGEG